MLPLYQKFYGKGFKMDPLVLDQSRISAGSQESANYIKGQTTIHASNIYSANKATPTPPGTNPVASGYAMGGIVRSPDMGRDSVMTMLRGQEEVLTPEQRVEARKRISDLKQSGTGATAQLGSLMAKLAAAIEKLGEAGGSKAPIQVTTQIHMDPKASQNLMEKGYVTMTRKNPREVIRSSVRGLQGDFGRRKLIDGLYG
jgi:hypothetical protein